MGFPGGFPAFCFSPRAFPAYSEAVCRGVAQLGIAGGEGGGGLAGERTSRSKQRPFSMAGAGRIAGAAKRWREVRNKEATVDIREAGIFHAGRRALPRRGEA